MLFFFKKNNQKIDKFAFLLADKLYSNVLPADAAAHFEELQPKSVNKKKQLASQNKVVDALNATIMELQQYRAVHKLGVYGKARLHLTFTERLKSLGYKDSVAVEINKLVLLRTP